VRRKGRRGAPPVGYNVPMDADAVLQRLDRVERPERLDAFAERYAGDLCHVDYWGVIARLWSERDRDAAPDARWTDIWRRASIAPGAQSGLMSEDERAALAALPGEVTVHRRPTGADWRGLDWTLERPPDGPIASVTVPRERIVALFDRGPGREVVVLPDGLRAAVDGSG
jgi:hypothetical protein